MRPLLLLIIAFSATLGLSALRAPPAAADRPCFRTHYETHLVAEACQGGQAEARRAMKAFVAKLQQQERAVECATCHAKVGGAYPLKPDGATRFKQYGGY